MDRYTHLSDRILAQTEPNDYRALITELEDLPQHEEAVQLALRLARACLAQADEMERCRAQVKEGSPIAGNHLGPEGLSGGMIILINRGPDRSEPLEKHRKFIAGLEELPPQHVNSNVRLALLDARAEMAWAEFLQATQRIRREKNTG